MTGHAVKVEKSGKGTEASKLPAAGAGEHPLMTLREEVDRLFDDFFRGWPGLMSFPSRMFSLDPFRRMGEPLVAGFGRVMPKVDVLGEP